MGRLLGILAAFVAYFSVATMITLFLLLGYALSKGYLDKEKLSKMAAIAQGIDSTAPTPPIIASAAEVINEPETHGQASLEDIEMRRAVHTRDLELREQAVDSQMQQLRSEQSKLADDKQNYGRQKAAFEKQLAQLHEGALATGRENIRLIWENIKPKQAKEQIVQMINAREQHDVVAILNAMPVSKRAKIIGEFKTEEDNKKLDEILDLIRRGLPEEKVINNAQQQINQVATQPSG